MFPAAAGKCLSRSTYTPETPEKVFCYAWPAGSGVISHYRKLFFDFILALSVQHPKEIMKVSHFGDGRQVVYID
jgi:hypothetical protein